MLAGQLLNNHAGLLLIGDDTSLHWLYEVVHDVNDRSPLIADRQSSFLALAYDVRKAYQGQREVIPPPEGNEASGVRYGVRILWPVLLVQQRVLRVSLGFLDHSRRHQAITYALESVIEEALRADFGHDYPAVAEQWMRLDPTHVDLIDKLDARGALFSAWHKRDRKRRFPALLVLSPCSGFG